MIDAPAALAALVAAAAALAFAAERRWRWAGRLGASLLAILFGALLSNLGLVPAASPVYDGVFGPVTSLAIAWLLLAVSLGDLRLAGPRMLAAYGLAFLSTIAAAGVATLAFAGALGPEAWKLGGVMVGTYSGGSLNFVAVARALGLPDALFAAATASDNVMTALWMVATLLLPGWLARFWPLEVTANGWAAEKRDQQKSPGGVARRRGSTAETEQASAAKAAADPGASSAAPSGAPAGWPLGAPVPLSVPDLAALVAIGLGLTWAGEAAAARFGLPAVVWLTTFALAAAQLPAVRRLRGALPLGTLALNLFFVVIGIGSRVAEILRVGLHVFAYTATVVLLHGLLLFLAARLARIDLETTSVASQAAIGGPSTAMALAIGRNRPHLALPGVLAGLLGYALGTYAGLAVAWALRGLL